MQDINLIKKLAWSFHRTTNVEWDDLFQEAALAYYEGLTRYDSSKGKISTFMYHHIKNHLINYVRKHCKAANKIELMDTIPNNTSSSIFEQFSKEARTVVDTILDFPRTFDSLKRRNALKRIREVMGVNHDKHRINMGIKELKIIFSNS